MRARGPQGLAGARRACSEAGGLHTACTGPLARGARLAYSAAWRRVYSVVTLTIASVKRPTSSLVRMKGGAT